eukprot:c21160_g1_i1 orf=283-1047(+)
MGGDQRECFLLQSFQVGPLPTIFYVPDYVQESEQLRLLRQVYAAPISKWKTLKNRRVQNWGGIVHEKGLLAQSLPQWLSVLTEKICKDTGLFPSDMNHVLVNEYLSGKGIMPHQDGPAYFPVVAIVSLGSPALIRFTPHSRIANAVNCPPIVSLTLMSGSLLIFKDSAYQAIMTDYLHGIDACSEHKSDETVVNLEKVQQGALINERIGCSVTENAEEEQSNAIHSIGSLMRNGMRVSLTCRLVAHVYRNLIKL